MRLQVFPPWELFMDGMSGEVRHIATERVKWSRKYQKKYNIASGEASTSNWQVAATVYSPASTKAIS